MAAWPVLVRSLHAHGGGPLVSSRFDEGMDSDAQRGLALMRAQALGLIHAISRCRGITLWALTPLGWDWCEGRVSMVYPCQPGSTGRKRGDCMRPVATWLKALPRAGEISLANP